MFSPPSRISELLGFSRHSGSCGDWGKGVACEDETYNYPVNKETLDNWKENTGI